MGTPLIPSLFSITVNLAPQALTPAGGSVSSICSSFFIRDARAIAVQEAR